MDWNISMVKGDTMAFGVELCSDTNDTPFTDAVEMEFNVKSSYDHNDMVFQLTNGDGITSLGDGQYIVRCAPEKTADVDAGDYYYDFSVMANGDVFTFLRGVLMIEEEV